MDDNKRLIRIEEKLAHLEKYLVDLDEVVRELGQRLDKQRDGVTAIQKMLVDHISDGEDTPGPADEKPPHW